MSTKQFYDGLNGLRLFSAYAVICTHISYQTGHVHNTFCDYFFGRLDIAVAVFFSLSGFLLWQEPAISPVKKLPEHKFRSSQQMIIRYYVHRGARILPSYWVTVVVVLCTLPSQLHTSWKIRAANFFLVQNYVPYGLVDGLTQMWSLDVEVIFYLCLPIIGKAMQKIGRCSTRQLVLLISLFGSLAWWALPISAPQGTFDIHSLLPGYWCWFVPGIMLAEYQNYLEVNREKHRESSDSRWGIRHKSWLSTIIFQKLLSQRLIMYPMALLSYLLIASPLGGPLGLQNPTTWQRIIRMFLGAVVAGSLLAPQIFSPKKPRTIFSLSHPLFVKSGYWAYGIFLWHLYIISGVFSLLQIFYFQGHYLKITFFSLIFATLLGAISYLLVEKPCFNYLVSWFRDFSVGKFCDRTIGCSVESNNTPIPTPLKSCG